MGSYSTTNKKTHLYRANPCTDWNSLSSLQPSFVLVSRSAGLPMVQVWQQGGGRGGGQGVFQYWAAGHLGAASSSFTLKKHKSYYLMSHRASPALLVLLLLLVVLPHAQNAKPAAPAAADGDLQLLDLSDLLKALNMTEADLANLTPTTPAKPAAAPTNTPTAPPAPTPSPMLTDISAKSTNIPITSQSTISGGLKDTSTKDSSNTKSTVSSTTTSTTSKTTASASSYGSSASQVKTSDASQTAPASIPKPIAATPADSTSPAPEKPKSKLTPPTLPSAPIITPTVTSTDNSYKTITTQIKSSKQTKQLTVDNSQSKSSTTATPAAVPASAKTPTVSVEKKESGVQTDSQKPSPPSIDDFALSLMDLSDLEALLGLPSSKTPTKDSPKPKESAETTKTADTEGAKPAEIPKKTAQTPISKPIEIQIPKKADPIIQTPKKVDASTQTSTASTKKPTPTADPSPTVVPVSPAAEASPKYPQLVDLGTAGNSSLIIGPGPKDPSLPPVLDLSKFVVDYNPGANKSSKTTANTVSNITSSSAKTTAPASTKDSTNAAANKPAQPKGQSKSSDNLVVDFNAVSNKTKETAAIKPASTSYDAVNFFQPAGDTGSNNLLIDFANPKSSNVVDSTSTAFTKSLPTESSTPSLPPAQPTTAFSKSVAESVNPSTPPAPPKTEKVDTVVSKPEASVKVEPVPAKATSNITILDVAAKISANKQDRHPKVEQPKEQPKKEVVPTYIESKKQSPPVEPKKEIVQPAETKRETTETKREIVQPVEVKRETAPRTEGKKETAPPVEVKKIISTEAKKELPKREEPKNDDQTKDRESQPSPKQVQPKQPVQPVSPPESSKPTVKPSEQRVTIRTPVIDPENGVKVRKSNLNNIYLSPNLGYASRYYDNDQDYDYSQIPNLPLPIQRQSKYQPPSLQKEEPVSNPPQLYQCWNSDNWAINRLVPSYKGFSSSYVVVRGDEYLSHIQHYLLKNYGNFLGDGELIAAFRQYNSYSNSLEYQLVYETTFGTFNSILTYFLDTPRVLLKSLSVINYFIMEVDYSNCLRKDQEAQNCKVCQSGYRNYMGRCSLYDGKCRRFRSDECDECQPGSKLSRGRCL